MLHFAALAILTATSRGAQRPFAQRAFLYDPAQIQAWNRANHINTLGADAQSRNKKPSQSYVTHVSVSGNFGGVFNVTGIGSATSQVESNAIAVNTNRPITFTANS